MCLWSGPQSDLVGVGEPTRGCQVLLGLVRTSWCQTKHYRFHSLDRSLQDRASGGHLGQGQTMFSLRLRRLCCNNAAPEECGCHSGDSAPQASNTPRSCHGGIGRLWGSRSVSGLCRRLKRSLHLLNYSNAWQGQQWWCHTCPHWSD